MIEEIYRKIDNSSNESIVRFDHIATSIACESNYDLTNNMNILPQDGFSSVFRR